jgi:hypothetical protein
MQSIQILHALPANFIMYCPSWQDTDETPEKVLSPRPHLPQDFIQLRQNSVTVPLQRGDLAIVLGQVVLLLGVTGMEPPAPPC